MKTYSKRLQTYYKKHLVKPMSIVYLWITCLKTTFFVLIYLVIPTEIGFIAWLHKGQF